MYQLSHLLSEQKSLLTTLASTSIFQHQELLPLNETETNKEEEDNIELKRKQILSDIADKIEGCIVSALRALRRALIFIFLIDNRWSMKLFTRSQCTQDEVIMFSFQNLTENSGRFFLYEGDLTELDAIDNLPMCKLHAFLLSDVLLLTSTIVIRSVLSWWYREYTTMCTFRIFNRNCFALADVRRLVTNWRQYTM